MSLLLDALKKAAEDKEKAGSEIVDSEKVVIEQNSEDAPEVNEELFLSDEIDMVDSLEEENLDLDLSHEIDDSELIDAELEAPVLESAVEKSPESLVGAVVKVPVETVVKTEVENKPEETLAEKTIVEPVVAKAEVTEVLSIEPKSTGNVYKTDANRPEYNHSDARKILEVSQKRYRSSQRMVYYGLYAFAALLFFAGSYLYYTAEILDNSDKPVFKENSRVAVNPKTVEEKKIEHQVMMAKAKLSEMDEIESKNLTVELVKKKKPKVVIKQKPKKIVITKQKRSDPISVLLQNAYQYYQAGEYRLADDLYKKILLRDKRLRDALLGRAAISIVNKNYVLARRIYQEVLHYYPRDSIAASALVDLKRQELTTANESQLNTLLNNNPKAAHVHFSLGLLYAKQGRVKESQQAFFDAFTLDKKADYAYNLAVMLEKIEQPKAALSYYKQASNLSDNTVIHFDEKLVLERIAKLEGNDE